MIRKPIPGLPMLGALALLCACSTQPASEATQAEPQQAGAAPGQASARTASPSATRGAAMKDEKAAKRSVYYDFDRYEIKAHQPGTGEANAKYLRTHPDVQG